MNEQNLDNQSQAQDNLIRNANISGDLLFAPVQIGTKIETHIVQISAAEVTQRSLIKSSPYQGLRRFNLKDQELFFGRDQLVTKLLAAVNPSNLSLVLGASGSGKSSVVRAGLIPELKKSSPANKFYDFIFSFIFTPNENPFESLYRCLLSEEQDYSFRESEARVALEARTDTLTNVISNLKNDDEQWLIFVDQFEELFTSCEDIAQRDNFIASLVQVANSGDNSVKIILAMRADFLEQLGSYPALGAIVNENNLHLVTDMHPDELRQAIEQPAGKHGVVFEEGLVEQIIDEVQGQKGYLPLLQYTLDLLWQTECKAIGANGHSHIEDRVVNRCNYAALEGVRGALQKQVNYIYNGLTPEEKLATQQIFFKLVNIVDTDLGQKSVSRRANRQEFVGEVVNKVLQIFIDENLLVSSSEELTAEQLKIKNSAGSGQLATVEIAHEILLSSWDRLKGWIESEKEAIMLKNWLASETKRWQKIRIESAADGEEELLKGSRLEQVIEFRKQGIFTNVGGLRAEENEFIDASVAARDRLFKAKEDRRKSQLIAISVTSILLAGFAIFAGFQWRKAELSQQKTEISRQKWIDASINVLKEFSPQDLLAQKANPGVLKVLENAEDWKILSESDKGIFSLLREYSDGKDKGKVFATAHEDILSGEKKTNAFLISTLDWLNLPKDQRKILISSGHCELVSLKPSSLNKSVAQLKNQLTKWQYAVQDIPAPLNETQLSKGSILIIGNAWGNFSQSEIDAIENFVKNGGSLFLVGSGKSWENARNKDSSFCQPEQQLGQNSQDISTYPMNRLVKPYQIQWIE